MPARGIRRGLGIHPVVEDSGDHLNMALWLHDSSHYAETHHRMIVSCDKTRDDRVKRTFTSGNTVWMSLFKCETASPALKTDPRSRHNDPGAETHEGGLNKGHHHSFFVGGGQINCAPGNRNRRPGGRGSFHSDFLRSFGKKGFIKQVLWIYHHAGRVGNMTMGLGKGDFHCLNLQVNALSGIHRIIPDVQMSQYS